MEMKQQCNKTTFNTKEDAKARIMEIKTEPSKVNGKTNRKGQLLKPRRAYFCPPCNGWHLTSLSVAKMQAIKRNHIYSVAQEWIRKKGWEK